MPITSLMSYGSLGLSGMIVARPRSEVRKPDHHVHGVVRLHLEEVAVVDHHADHVLDVVRLLGIVRDDRREARRGALGTVGRLSQRRLLVGALRYVLEEAAHLRKALVFGF